MIKGLTFLLVFIASIGCNLKLLNTETSLEAEEIVDYVYTCNLKNNPDSIAEYKYYHSTEGVWPEVIKTFEESGAISVKIYLIHTRLVMIVSLPKSLSYEEFNERYANAYPEKIKEWGKLMGSYGTPPPFAKEGENWVQMERIFEFEKN